MGMRSARLEPPPSDPPGDSGPLHLAHHPFRSTAGRSPLISTVWAPEVAVREIIRWRAHDARAARALIVDGASLAIGIPDVIQGACPWARNHSTASANACRGGVWGNPNSRIALAGLNHIL